MSAQIIEKNGKPEWAVLPYEEYLRLLELAEEAQDVALYRGAKGASVEEVIPAEVVNRLLDGDNPVKVWREYRSLSQRQLAKRTGISHTYAGLMMAGRG
jgi:hypothetical protein